MASRLRTRLALTLLYAVPLSLSACGGGPAKPSAASDRSSAASGGERQRDQKLTAPITVKDVGFMTPDSVLYDPEADVYLVSNVEGSALDADDRGFISRLLPDGTLDALKWIDSGQPDVTLDAPKGMALLGKVLYVADISHVRKFDRRTGKPLGSVAIEGSTFLNDVAAHADGSLLVTDTGLSTGFTPSGSDALYRLGTDGSVQTVVKDVALGHPSGVAAAPDGLWVVSFGSGELYQVGATGERSPVYKAPKGSLAGVVYFQNGALISSWEGSAIYRCQDGEMTEIVSALDTPADIGLDTRRERLLIPLYNANAVVIHQL